MIENSDTTVKTAVVVAVTSVAVAYATTCATKVYNRIKTKRVEKKDIITTLMEEAQKQK